LRCSWSAWWYWKSLNLTEEDWLGTILSDHYHEF
jgi:hypothetical protein